jgi:hypothetical protein
MLDALTAGTFGVSSVRDTAGSFGVSSVRDTAGAPADGLGASDDTPGRGGKDDVLGASDVPRGFAATAGALEASDVVTLGALEASNVAAGALEVSDVETPGALEVSDVETPGALEASDEVAAGALEASDVDAFAAVPPREGLPKVGEALANMLPVGAPDASGLGATLPGFGVGVAGGAAEPAAGGGDESGLGETLFVPGDPASRLGLEARVGLGGFDTCPGDPGSGGRIEGEEVRVTTETGSPHFEHEIVVFPRTDSSAIVETVPHPLQVMFMTVRLPPRGLNESNAFGSPRPQEAAPGSPCGRSWRLSFV